MHFQLNKKQTNHFFFSILSILTSNLWTWYENKFETVFLVLQIQRKDNCILLKKFMSQIMHLQRPRD